MITALILFVAMSQGDAISITYSGVPPDVDRAVVHRWIDRASPVAIAVHAERADGRWTLAAAAGANVIVSFLEPDGSYIIDGPFRWPSSSTTRNVDGYRRRSVRLDLLAETTNEDEIAWMASDGRPDVWPSCVREGPRAVMCWGVPLAGAGVIYVQTPGRLSWSVVTGAAAGPVRDSAWGRLLVVPSVGVPMTGLQAKIEYPVQSAQRARSVRVRTTSVPSSGGLPVGSSAIWIHGRDVPDRAWIELRAARAGPVYLSLADVAAAPSSLPVHVALDESRSIEGVVVGASATPAAGALVTVFRFLSPAGRALVSSDADPPARAFVSEVTSDGEGAFAIDGLGAADYEIVAWHPQQGRASVQLDGRARIEIRLESSGAIRGRVLSGGKPAAGADVISVPDRDAARIARDLVDLTGGNVRTGPDGRFVVAAAPAGGGELRVGGGRYPIRRMPLPRAPMHALDLGDIELGSAIAITVSLDSDPGCDLRAAGPIGRTGLLLVAGVRAGPGLYRIDIPEEGTWEFTLSCGGAERALSPAVRAITSALSGKEVQFAVR